MDNMIIKKIMILCMVLMPFQGALSQQEGSMVLTLDEAQEYALSHNKTLQGARLDVRAAEMARWDVLANGLPRVDGSGSLNDNLKLMTNLLPAEIFGGEPGTYIPVQFGTKYNTSYGVQATQLIFSAPYFVGLSMAKLTEKISNQALEKSELDIRESVISTYYLILVSEESLIQVEKNIDNLRDILKSTEAMYSVGMAEATDVDQMKSNITMIENSRRSVERNIEFSYNLLRFQMGLEVEKDIELATTLDQVIAATDVESLLSAEFDYTKNIDYLMLQSQENLSSLSLDSEKAALLPSLSGFYSWTKSGMGNKLNDLQWFPNSMLGFQINIPIFASGQRWSRIRKARFELDKARISSSAVTDNLLLQEKQLRYNLINAREQYESQRDNVEVAERIYKSVNNKYREGMVSSLELTQAHNNLLTAESNHINSLMTLLQTKLALEKLLNEF